MVQQDPVVISASAQSRISGWTTSTVQAQKHRCSSAPTTGSASRTAATRKTLASTVTDRANGSYQVVQTLQFPVFFMPPPFEEWWRGIKCYPCPCVCASVRACVCPSVRYQLLKDCFDSIQIWYVDISYQDTGRVRFGLQSTNF